VGFQQVFRWVYPIKSGGFLGYLPRCFDHVLCTGMFFFVFLSVRICVSCLCLSLSVLVQDNAVCSRECSRNGCWGPADTQCLSCANFTLAGGRCVSSCSALPNIYQDSVNTCSHCDPECDGCTNAVCSSRVGSGTSVSCSNSNSVWLSSGSSSSNSSGNGSRCFGSSTYHICSTQKVCTKQQLGILKLLLRHCKTFSMILAWSGKQLCQVEADEIQRGQNHFYAQKQLLHSAHLSHRNSVCLSVCLSVRPSVTWVDQSKTVQARITKSSLSAAWKTRVSGTVKLFHKFEGSHPKRGH